jgi:predicted dehydrogenase
VVIGAGYFSKFQLEAWSRIPEVRVLAVCDLVQSKAQEAAAAIGIGRVYTDWREMIEREHPTLVDIITPPSTHEEICAFTMARGIHTICQKPLAPTLEASERIVALSRSGRARLMVHENWRWQPWYRKIKELQQTGVLGEFTHLHFRMRMGDGWGERAYLDRQPFFRDYPRLLLYETGVHFVDTFRYLLGEVVEVYSQLRRLNPVIQGEDAGQAFFRFASGATAIWDANRYNEVESPTPRFTFGELRIDATRGHLAMDTSSNLRLKLLGQPACDVNYHRENVNFAGDCVYHLQRHFIDTNFESNAEDYLNTLRVVEALYTSAAAGQVVPVQSWGGLQSAAGFSPPMPNRR